MEYEIFLHLMEVDFTEAVLLDSAHMLSYGGLLSLLPFGKYIYLMYYIQQEC